MMDSEVQKTAPRYVLATPGHREGTRVSTATFPVPERFSATAQSTVLFSWVSSPHVLTCTLQGRYYYLYFTNKDIRLREVKERAGGHPANERKTTT